MPNIMIDLLQIWFKSSVNKKHKSSKPTSMQVHCLTVLPNFHCYSKDAVKQPSVNKPTSEIKKQFTGSRKYNQNFWQNIRVYNFSMAFASVCLTGQGYHFRKQGPYCYGILRDTWPYKVTGANKWTGCLNMVHRCQRISASTSIPYPQITTKMLVVNFTCNTRSSCSSLWNIL